MKIAIDIDDTITAVPEFFKNFIKSNKKDEIHILTGQLPYFYSNKYKIGNKENVNERIFQLAKLGICNKIPFINGGYHKLVSIIRENQYPDIGIGKAEYCRDNNIDIVFEDNMEYIKEIKKLCPDIKVFYLPRQFNEI